MKTVTEVFDITTVGALREALKNLPDDTEITVYNTGDTGMINGFNLEVNTWEESEPDVYINIKAESAFY